MRLLISTVTVACLALPSIAQELTFNQMNPFAAPAGGNQALFLDDLHLGDPETDGDSNVFVGIVTDIVMKEETEYVIEAAVGNALGVNDYGEDIADQSIQLWSTEDTFTGDSYGHMVQSFTGYEPSWPNRAEDGEWVTNQTSFTTGFEGDNCVENECVGEFLTILLSNYNYPPGNERRGKAYYDNVRVLEDGVEVWSEDFEGTPNPLQPGQIVSPEVLGWSVLTAPGRNDEDFDANLISYGIFSGGSSDLACDFNGDGGCTTADLNSTDGLYSVGELTDGVNVPPADAKFDLDGNNVVDGGDITEFLAQAGAADGKTGPYLAGDTDLDGTIAFNDFVSLSSAFGSGKEWSQGNFDGSDSTGFNDFVALSGNFLASVNPGTAQSVPEPSGLWLLSLGLAWFVRCCRPRS